MSNKKKLLVILMMVLDNKEIILTCGEEIPDKPSKLHSLS